MRVVSIRRIYEFIEKHEASSIALQDWYHRVSSKKWYKLSDIKRDFNSVDYVGNNRYVFNIKGNNYRLVCIIIFASQKVYIRFIGTHAQYDKIDVKNI
ncbi:MAG: type II toxin-antitoxin system HigB family toxin [Bacteroidetes bacterium]|nr:MAG: type II toxin-antitoxin system HigB family toxin [Bacteroidota bacterium]